MPLEYSLAYHQFLMSLSCASEVMIIIFQFLKFFFDECIFWVPFTFRYLVACALVRLGYAELYDDEGYWDYHVVLKMFMNDLCYSFRCIFSLMVSTVFKILPKLCCLRPSLLVLLAIFSFSLSAEAHDVDLGYELKILGPSRSGKYDYHNFLTRVRLPPLDSRGVYSIDCNPRMETFEANGYKLAKDATDSRWYVLPFGRFKCMNTTFPVKVYIRGSNKIEFAGLITGVNTEGYAVLSGSAKLSGDYNDSLMVRHEGLVWHFGLGHQTIITAYGANVEVRHDCGVVQAYVGDYIHGMI